MEIKVYGNSKVKGKVNISGSKNAALPIICASILNKGKVILKNIPRISDVFDMCNILKYLNCKVNFKGNTLIIMSKNIVYKPLLLEECKKIRASYYFIGVFLFLFKKCEILLPGGCKIGSRPIDYHLKAFNDMGYKYNIENNILTIEKEKNNESFDITLINKSVGTTMNVILAGLGFNDGIIGNSLIEPECEDLISFLNIIGFNIENTSSNVVIKAHNKINTKIKYEIIPDRIEAMTYTVLGLLCGDLVINKCNPKHLLSPLNILKEAGYKLDFKQECLHVYKSVGNQINIKTDVYPGFPTDLQPIFGVLASQTKNISSIEENIFDNRMQIYNDLIVSNVECIIDKNNVKIIPANIISKDYTVYDLRHGAAVLLLALIGNGSSKISNFELVLRGYENILQKLSKIGIYVKS